MNVYLALLISVGLIAFFSFLICKLGGNKSRKHMKYIPAAASAVSIGLIYLKMLFVSKGYQPIIDIVLMIMMAGVLGVFLLLAVGLDLWNKKTKKQPNL